MKEKELDDLKGILECLETGRTDDGVSALRGLIRKLDPSYFQDAKSQETGSHSFPPKNAS